MNKYSMFQKAELSFEVVMLLIAGLVLLEAGILLFPVSQGILPYYEDGLYGLFLILFSLQIIILGKTPFGDLIRSKLLLSAGTAIAATGVATCFIPGLLGHVPRYMLFICFGLGGGALLVQLFIHKDKYRTWSEYGGIFRHLIAGCTAVYLLSMLIGLLIIRQEILNTQITAVIILLYGCAVIYLACILQKIYRLYPQAEKPFEGGVKLGADKAMILLMSIFMVLLGLLLIPVSLGLLPFSASAQLGLLMFLFAIQMMALGSTPVGPFPRTRLMILLGFLFASLGIVSCIVPGILVFHLTILVGTLNIFGGIITLSKIFPLFIKRSKETKNTAPSILLKLYAAQFTMGLLSVLFGISMFAGDIISGLIVGAVLASNGGVLLYMLHILMTIDSMKERMATEAI